MILGGVAGREGERAALQPAQVQREAVALPGQDLQAIAAAIAEDEQITAQRVAAQMGRHDGCESVHALTAVLRLQAHPNTTGHSKR